LRDGQFVSATYLQLEHLHSQIHIMKVCLCHTRNVAFQQEMGSARDEE